MARKADSLITYANPPVVEVVCGVTFNQLIKFQMPHFGLLWERFREEYPECKEMPPLVPVVEGHDGSPSTAQITLSEVPPLPRNWFIRDDGHGIIQVQRDRFLHNWRKLTEADEYPRYHVVIGMFRKLFSDFEAFLRDSGLGDIDPLQYEMTYVNHLPQGKGWDRLADVGAVFPDLCWRKTEDRFLPDFEGINWQSVFPLPERTGRLHVSVKNAQRKPDGLPILSLNLTVRGMPKDPAREAMWEWFDTARKWIVRGFADLTGDDIQRTVWGRKDA